MTNIGGIGYSRSYVGKRSEMGMYDEAMPKELLEHIEPPKETKVATGCPLCDKIWSSKEAYEYIGKHSINSGLAIVRLGNKLWLYVLGDDWYVMPINYCPTCGRRLAGE